MNKQVAILKEGTRKEVDIMAMRTWSSIGKSENNKGKATVARVKLETGKPFKFAILGDPVEFKQHVIKGKLQGRDAFRSIRCDGDCPICNAGKYKATTRFAFNVLDLFDNEVKVLEVGRTVIEQIQTVAMLGMNPLDLTWVITKSGTGTNTVYSCMQLGQHMMNEQVLATFTQKLYDLEEVFKLHTEEEAKRSVTGIGVSWEDVTTEQTFRVPTLKEAKAMRMPFGKHKGKTLGEIYEEDRSSNGWMNWFAFNANPSELRNGARVILSEEGGLHFDGLEQTP